MRKKSHISLAGQIMDSMELDNVFDYRLPFYVGSIWPDCKIGRASCRERV